MFETLRLKNQISQELQRAHDLTLSTDEYAESLFRLEQLVVYDGVAALQHYAWMRSPSFVTDRDLLNMRKKELKNCALADLLRARKVVAELARKGFDLNCLQGDDRGIQSDKWDSTTRKRILQAIVERKTQLLGKAYLPADKIRRVKKVMQIRKEAKAAEDSLQQLAVKNRLENPSFHAEPLSTGDIVYITTHQNPHEVHEVIPGNVQHTSLVVESGVGRGKVEQVDADGKPVRISDRDGEIPLEHMLHFIQAEAEWSVVLSGGNVRGCLATTLTSVMRGVERVVPPRTDIHYPLFSMYDSDAYDDQPIKMFPLDYLKSWIKRTSLKPFSYEAYIDGILVDGYVVKKKVDDEKTDDEKVVNTKPARYTGSESSPILRLYLWSSQQNMNEGWLNHVRSRST